jgi:hypothetical protein
MNRQVDKEGSLGSWRRGRPTAAGAIRTAPRRAGVGPHGDAHHSTTALTAAVATLAASGE